MLTKKLIALTTFVFLVSLITIPNVYAWYSGYSNWRYRQPITITEQSGNTLTDYQVKLTIDTASLISAGKMNSDCSDIRFTDENDNPLPYWIESGCNSDNTIVWVKVPEIPANGQATIYMYYGNSNAESESNGENVFEFFDDFEGTSLDTSKWSILGNPSISMSGSQITISSSIKEHDSIYTQLFSLPLVLEWKTITTDGQQSIGIWNPLPTGTDRDVIWVFDQDGNLKSYHMVDNTATNDYNQPGNAEGRFQLKTDGNIYSLLQDGIERVSSVSWGTAEDSFYIVIDSYYAGSITIDYIFLHQYASTEPTYSIGSEQIQGGTQITISSPEAKTYYTINITANFTVSDTDLTSYYVKAWIDGQLIYDNSNYVNGTEVDLNLQSYITQDKQYNFTVWVNATNEISQSVFFTVETIPYFTNITISPESPQTYGISQIWFNVSVADLLNNQQSVILETNLTGSLANYTFLNDTPTHFYYNWTVKPSAGNYTYKFYVNDTTGNWNETNIYNYTINKANANLILQSTDGWDVYVGTTVTISASSTVQTPHLKINNITVENPYTFIPEVGFYDVYAWIDDYQNYTDWNVSETLSVMSLPTCVDNETFTFKKTINVNQQYVILNFSLPISLHHVKDDLTDVKIDGNVSSIHKNNSVIILEMNSYPSEVDVYFGNEFANYTYQEEPIPSGENIKIENYEQINSYLIVNILDEETAQPLYPPESTLYAITGCSLGQSIFRLKENTTKFLVASKTPINEMSIRVKYTADAYYKRTRFFDNITSGTINIYVSDALQHAVDRIDLTMGDPTHYNSLCQFYKKQSGHDVVITEARFDTSHQLYAFLLEDTEYNIRVIDTDGSIAEYGTITLVEYTVKTIGESSISITSSTQLISNHIIFNAYYNEDNTTHVDYIDDLDETEILTITIKNSTGDAIYENTWYNTSELHMDINTSGQNVEVDLNATHQSLGNVKSSIFVTKSVEHNYNIGIDENKLNIFILVVLISIAGLISTRNFIAGVIIFDIALIFFKAVGWITISLVSIFFVIILTVIAVIIYIREVRL